MSYKQIDEQFDELIYMAQKNKEFDCQIYDPRYDEIVRQFLHLIYDQAKREERERIKEIISSRAVVERPYPDMSAEIVYVSNIIQEIDELTSEAEGKE